MLPADTTASGGANGPVTYPEADVCQQTVTMETVAMDDQVRDGDERCEEVAVENEAAAASPAQEDVGVEFGNGRWNAGHYMNNADDAELVTHSDVYHKDDDDADDQSMQPEIESRHLPTDAEPAQVYSGFKWTPPPPGVLFIYLLKTV